MKILLFLLLLGFSCTRTAGAEVDDIIQGVKIQRLLTALQEDKIFHEVAQSLVTYLLEKDQISREVAPLVADEMKADEYLTRAEKLFRTKLTPDEVEQALAIFSQRDFMNMFYADHQLALRRLTDKEVTAQLAKLKARISTEAWEKMTSFYNGELGVKLLALTRQLHGGEMLIPCVSDELPKAVKNARAKLEELRHPAVSPAR